MYCTKKFRLLKHNFHGRNERSVRFTEKNSCLQDIDVSGKNKTIPLLRIIFYLFFFFDYSVFITMFSWFINEFGYCIRFSSRVYIVIKVSVDLLSNFQSFLFLFFCILWSVSSRLCKYSPVYVRRHRCVSIHVGKSQLSHVVPRKNKYIYLRIKKEKKSWYIANLTDSTAKNNSRSRLSSRVRYTRIPRYDDVTSCNRPIFVYLRRNGFFF